MGRPAVTYKDNLKNDTSLESAEELRTAMLDKETWKRHAESRKGPCSAIVVAVARGRNMSIRSTFSVTLCHHLFLDQLFGLSNLC